MNSSAQQNFLRKSAWRFLIRYSVRSLPIDVFSLCRQMGVTVRNYTDASVQIQHNEAYICKHFDPDGFAIWSKKSQSFCIYYNQSALDTTIRWTLMHELAHIHLGHIQRTSYYARTKVPFRQWIEMEADGFTRRVLCPSIVLHEIQALTPQRIALCCGISAQAAQHRAELMAQLEQRNCFLLDPLEKQVALQFAEYIRKEIKKNYTDY